MSVQTITKADWAERVLQASTPVMVKFGAEWCGPCKSMKPVLDDLATEYPGVSIVDVDIDDEKNVGMAQSFNVRGIPTIIVFDKGAEATRLVGAQSKGHLADLLKHYSSNSR